VLGAQIATSSDGFHWTNQVSGVQGLLSSVTFGGDTFVVVGEPELILSSADGINWTQRPATVEALGSVTYGKDSVVAVGGYYTAVPIAAALQSGGQPQMCLQALGWAGPFSAPYFTLMLWAEGPFRLQYSPVLTEASWTDLFTAEHPVERTAGSRWFQSLRCGPPPLTFPLAALCALCP
jgi:hypothetical protein